MTNITPFKIRGFNEGERVAILANFERLGIYTSGDTGMYFSACHDGSGYQSASSVRYLESKKQEITLDQLMQLKPEPGPENELIMIENIIGSGSVEASRRQWRMTVSELEGCIKQIRKAIGDEPGVGK